MLKKTLLTVLGLVLIVFLLGGTYALMIRHLIAAGASQTMPVLPVTTTTLKADTWQPTLVSVGSLTAVQGVTLSAQLDGSVTGLNFQAGSKVNAGDLLVQMDISVEQAQLRAAEAAVLMAGVSLKRSKELLAENTISQSQLDSDEANYAQAQAQADNIRATIGKKTIRAPFAGRLGVRLINLGQTLKAGDPIVSLQALDPIFADFYLPQQRLSEISAGLEVNTACDAFPDQVFAGKITAISPDVDATTRNVRVQATLANADERLHPGMYVTVSVLLPGRLPVLAVPMTAVLYAPFGDSVFVVDEQKDATTGAVSHVIRQQLVRLGRKQGDFVDLVSGVKAGEMIVTSGVFKLHKGMVVAPDNTQAPDAQLTPHPSDS